MRNAVLAVVLAVAAHAALGLAFAVYARLAPAPQALATLDLSSVELSMSDKDDDTAPAVSQLPMQPTPQQPKPRTVEPLPPPNATVATLPPKPTAMKFAEPEERSPEMVTPPPRCEEQEEQLPSTTQPNSAVAPQQAKIDAPPRPKRPIKPYYPKGCQQRGEQGEVMLELKVGADGRVIDVKTVKSSGYAELDAAARRAAKGAVFNPAMSNGKPIESIVRQPVFFRLP